MTDQLKIAELMELWQRYQLAIQQEVAKGRDYDGDRVQAAGVAFAYHWNQNKALICQMVEIDPDPTAKPSKEEPDKLVWGYGIARVVMSRLLG